MSEKHYSVAEIDRMRECIRWSYPGEPMMPADRDADIENRLRTYMLNGTTVSELEEDMHHRLSAHAKHTETK